MLEIPGHQISKEVGAGGMARVYLATQLSLDREVAIKVMSPALAADPGYSKRFLREARVIASLQHPNIVAIYDIGSIGHQHYFSMQLLTGGDLGRKLKKGIREEELVRILSLVARALGFAHGRGIVHRDVTPGNILFDAADNPVLTDFGIARTASDSTRITSTGVSIGTSSYMSPEQARGQETDARSDLYSLGALLFECLTGTPPYRGADGFAVAYAHVFEPIPRLPAALAHWQGFIDQALAKNPADRHADAEAFRDGLNQVATRGLLLPFDPARQLADPAPVVAAPRSAALVPVPRPTPAAASLPLPPAPASMAAASAPRWLPYAFAALALLGVLLIGLVLWQGRESEAPVPTVPSAAAPPTSTPIPPMPLPPSLPPGIPESPTTEEGIPGEAIAADDLSPVGPPTPAEQAEALRLQFRQLLRQNALTAGNVNALTTLAQLRLLEKDDLVLSALYGELYAAMDVLLEKDLADGNLAQARDRLDRLAQIASRAPPSSGLAERAASRRDAEVDARLARADEALARWRGDLALTAVSEVAALKPDHPGLEARRKLAERIGKPGYRFRDRIGTGEGPEMVVVDGSLAFAIHEVTVGEYERFVAATGHPDPGRSCNNKESVTLFASRSRNWRAPGWTQGPSHPVVCIGLADARRYTEWLTGATGKRYRLPARGEWERLAVRSAGEAACGKANLGDQRFAKEFTERNAWPCDDGHAGAAPVGRFEKGPFGIADLGGNVREWVDDCADPPRCRRAQAMGRSWASDARESEMTSALLVDPQALNNTVGFRVVREITEDTRGGN